MKSSSKRNFTIEKTAQNEAKFCYRKNSSKSNEILFRNISKFFHRHSFVSLSFFENSCEDGKWPLGVFNAALK